MKYSNTMLFSLYEISKKCYFNSVFSSHTFEGRKSRSTSEEKRAYFSHFLGTCRNKKLKISMQKFSAFFLAVKLHIYEMLFDNNTFVKRKKNKEKVK